MQEDARQRVAAAVRAELGRKGRTGADAGRVLGKSRQAMSKRLTGARAFRAEELGQLAEWLEVPVARLHGEEREGVAA